MASQKWRELPGGRVKRWKKSAGDFRPGGGTTRFAGGVPPRWYRNLLNRRDRRRAVEALHRGAVEPWPYVHPREAPWFW
jgi:hypothetical protein